MLIDSKIPDHIRQLKYCVNAWSKNDFVKSEGQCDEYDDLAKRCVQALDEISPNEQNIGELVLVYNHIILDVCKENNRERYLQKLEETIKIFTLKDETLDMVLLIFQDLLLRTELYGMYLNFLLVKRMLISLFFNITLRSLKTISSGIVPKSVPSSFFLFTSCLDFLNSQQTTTALSTISQSLSKHSPQFYLILSKSLPIISTCTRHLWSAIDMLLTFQSTTDSRCMTADMLCLLLVKCLTCTNEDLLVRHIDRLLVNNAAEINASISSDIETHWKVYSHAQVGHLVDQALDLKSKSQITGSKVVVKLSDLMDIRPKIEWSILQRNMIDRLISIQVVLENIIEMAGWSSLKLD